MWMRTEDWQPVAWKASSESIENELQLFIVNSSLVLLAVSPGCGRLTTPEFSSLVGSRPRCEPR